MRKLTRSKPGMAALAVLALALTATLAGLAPAQAGDAAAFYRGRDLNLIEGFNVGGGADLYTRIIAKHLAGHIAGHPMSSSTTCRAPGA